MATPVVFPEESPVIFNGTVSFGKAINFPSGSVTNTDIEASAAIDASKLVCHRSVTNELFGLGVEPAATTYIVIHTNNAAGSLMSFQATITGTLMASSGQEVSVNLYRSNAGSTFATALSAAIELGSSVSTIRVPQSGTFAATTMAASDLWAVGVTLAGTSTTARGLAVTMHWSEKFA